MTSGLSRKLTLATTSGKRLSPFDRRLNFDAAMRKFSIIRLGPERLAGARLDRVTRHVSILSLNGDSYRLKTSRSRRGCADRRVFHMA